MDWSTALLLGLGGVGIGAYGTLIGIGGGVVLIPLLLYLYPGEAPRTVTAISLAVVFLNALSGTLAYNRMKRIDFRTGIVFSLATVPGAILGVLATFYISRTAYQVIFGVLLTALSVYIFLRPTARLKISLKSSKAASRLIIDRDGANYQFSFNLGLGIAISFGVGLIAGLLGIGGGIIHVPAMVNVLGFPAHVATATSQFILVITTFSGGVTHLLAGSLVGAWTRVIVLGAGVTAGAQLGARLSTRLGGAAIVRLLAAALLLVGLRLIMTV
ncbi:MAG: sulfite exporter TauE/SafE family protein [Chloroflexi bacterium]|nr:sulfite exporter TauE/SafE family protein [Chloroflexota bacterium]